MLAFEAAVEEGVDALETDLHISKDGVLVISHVSIGLARVTMIWQCGPLILCCNNRILHYNDATA